MKKHNLLFVIACLVITNINAQILKKSFYDLNGSKPKEVYFVNANGEKNGNYKSYYDDGLVSVEANYKNGVLDGVYKEYQWLGSKAAIKMFITYKDGVKNGNSIYYGGENYSIKSSQGNYINDKKEGVWKVVEETSSTMPEGFRYFTYDRTYKDDKVIEESQTWFYYPSNKVFAETKNGVRTSFSPDGKKTGEETFNEKKDLVEEKFFFINGSIAENNKYYVEEGKIIEEKKSWYENGNVKKKTKSIKGSYPLSFEAYKLDGSKDDEMLRFEKNNKSGKFKILYDENWEEISDKNKCAYYREIEYKNGVPFGLVKEYYVTGEIVGEFYLKSENPDVKFGILKEYYKNGKLQFVINYNSQSLPDGKALRYYESGNLSDSSFFESGELKYSISYNQNLKKSHEKILISRYEWTQLSQKGVAFPLRSEKTGKERKTYLYFDYYDNGNFKIKAKSYIDDDKKTKFFDKLEHYSEAGILEKTEIYDVYGELKK